MWLLLGPFSSRRKIVFDAREVAKALDFGVVTFVKVLDNGFGLLVVGVLHGDGINVVTIRQIDVNGGKQHDNLEQKQ